MKWLVTALLFFPLLTCGQRLSKKTQREFAYHFKLLDSLAMGTKSNTILNCAPSIEFMERTTGIYSQAETTFFGKFYCYKSEVDKWRAWYRLHTRM